MRESGRVVAWSIALMGQLSAPYGYASEPTRPLAYLAFDGDYWQVWTSELDGSEPRQLTRSQFDKIKISWFPAGNSLLVCGNSGEIVIVATQSGLESPVSLSQEHGADATVSPDGAWIAYSAMNVGSPDTNDIWVARSDGTDARRIATMPALQHEPVWSQDGQELYFLSGAGGQSHDIYRVHIDGQRLEQLTAGHLYHFDVAAARDGTLAFSANRSGNYDLWLRDSSGKEWTIVASPQSESQPAWGPGDRRLLFTRTSNGVSNIWSVAPDGSNPRAVTHHERGARGAAIWKEVIVDGAQP